MASQCVAASHDLCDLPAPLRIVKGPQKSLQLTYNSLSARDPTHRVTDQEFSDKESLWVPKRQDRSQTPGAKRAYWTSVVDLSNPHARAWEEAIARCRGLLRRSSPNLRTCRRYLSWSRFRALHSTGSSGEYSSSQSSRRHGNGESSRTTSESTDASTAMSEGGCQPVSGGSRNPSGVPHQLSPRQMSRDSSNYILSPGITVVSQQQNLDVDDASV